TEPVQGPSLPLQCINNVHRSHSLPPSVLSVGNSVPDDVLQEDLENSASLLVDETADSLHTSSASKTADSRLGDSLDVVPQNLPVPLRSSLSETLSSLAAAGHLIGEEMEALRFSESEMI
ncbi:hypothetical protein LINPERHAP2_LOCUS27095, partial [Linum perenne]